MKRKFLLGATIASLLLSFPKLNFGQAPSLGTAKSFAVFTAAGAVSNSGASGGTEVWGNVGTHVGAFTAFPPGILHGQIHVANPTSFSAAADVAVLYSDLSGRTPCTVLGVTIADQTLLTPGLYCTGAATTLDGELILDGLSNPNALFIFQIGGAFSTSSFARISVINSANLCNVFWQINGAFTLGPGSVFKGTVVSNAAIHLLEGSILWGRALTTSGAIDMHNNPVIDVSISGCNVLPVSFSSFTANRTNPANVLLRWETVNEIYNSGFAIERNMGNNSWELVSFIPTQTPGGNSSSLLTYTFNDLNSNKGITQYRIKQVDLDGRARYSETRAVRGDAQKGKIIVYPNPSADGRVNIVFEDQKGVRDVTVADISGRTIRQWKSVSNNTLQIENLRTGMYTLRVVMRETGNQRVEKLIVAQY